MLTIPSRVIAASFALMGFAAAAVVGGLADNPALTVLWRALLVMAACWLIGRMVGFIAQKTIYEHIETYKEQNPIPDITGDAESEVNVDVETDDAASEQPASAGGATQSP